MKMTITFDCDNDAFRDDLFPYEVNSILQKVKEKVATLFPVKPSTPAQEGVVRTSTAITPILDINGNMVGSWTLEWAPEEGP